MDNGSFYRVIGIEIENLNRKRAEIFGLLAKIERSLANTGLSFEVWLPDAICTGGEPGIVAEYFLGFAPIDGALRLAVKGICRNEDTKISVRDNIRPFDSIENAEVIFAVSGSIERFLSYVQSVVANHKAALLGIDTVTLEALALGD
jgi:hypothetical protein